MASYVLYLADGSAYGDHQTAAPVMPLRLLALEVEARGPNGGLRGSVHVAQTVAAGNQSQKTRPKRLSTHLEICISMLLTTRQADI